ncbi:hypothetical protein [Parasphingopyxis marina]|uniref:Uncharacterized protein n=1 Tax=Parasphingopyxis marina TaxID=2761622 RepID=A0A842HVB3_9SPHN|nr:hypothetical protein [Parasphingopyxis marina]MBC2776453.1 hypothetical protein [Parasphingopyxis marina]
MAKISKSPKIKHPLRKVDKWERYDQLLEELNYLTQAKRETEDGFVKTIIQLSAAILLLVPTFFSSQALQGQKPSNILICGLSLIAISLLASLSEQYLSSRAYTSQISKTEKYYKMEISDIDPPDISLWVSRLLLTSFAGFILGILLLAYAILRGPWS